MKARRLGTVGTGTGPLPMLLHTQHRLTLDELLDATDDRIETVADRLRHELQRHAAELGMHPTNGSPSVTVTVTACVWVAP